MLNSFIRSKKIFSTSILSFLLVSCVATDEQSAYINYIDPQDPIWQQNLQKLKQIRSYATSGQLGYISDKERFSSRFDWRYQNPQSYQLQLSSTIATTTLLIEMKPEGMKISDNKGNLYESENAQQLLQQVMGISFPLEYFNIWLKGQPDESQQYNVGENHLLANFVYTNQDGNWSVDYLSYHNQYAPPLPKDIMIKNQDKTLKIRADNWIY